MVNYMSQRISRKTKGLEKYLYVSNKTYSHMPKKGEQHKDMVKKDSSRKITKEEVELVNKAIKAEMEEIDSGKQKTFTSRDIKKELGL